MSLATLKVKVQKLIEQAMYKKYWQKLWTKQRLTPSRFTALKIRKKRFER